VDRRHRGHAGVKQNFPILADADKKVSNLYDMIHPEASDTFTVRSVFFIDPKQEDPRDHHLSREHGRNFAEILRVIDSLQLNRRLQGRDARELEGRRGRRDHPEPSRIRRKLAKLFPKGHKELKPYLRMDTAADK